MKKLKVSLMVAFIAIGITGAFAFKGNANFSCSGQLFYLDEENVFRPVNTQWDCIQSEQTCVYYEDGQGIKQPCLESEGTYTVIVP